MAKDYEIGYGMPPKHSQFKPGQSGNPEGKPKGTKSLKTVVRKEAYAKVSIKVNGKWRKITRVEALFKSMMAKGINGDTKAAAIALRLMETHLPALEPGSEGKQHLTDEELQVLKTNADFLGLMKETGDDQAKA